MTAAETTEIYQRREVQMDDRQFGEVLEQKKKTQPEEKKGSSAPAGKMVWREPGD